MDQLRELINVGQADISTLNLDCSVNSVVISAYLRLIERRSIYYRSRNVPKLWVFETKFWKDWNEGGFEKVKEAIGTVELLKKDILLVPLHISYAGNADHWCLIVIRINLCEINAFDSLGLARTKELDSVFKFVQVYAKSIGKHLNPNQWIIKDTPTTCPKQFDTISSGVYVCVFAERIARSCDPTIKPIDSKYARKTILAVLRRERFDSEDFSTLIDSKKWWVGNRYGGIPGFTRDFNFDEVFHISRRAHFLTKELFSSPKSTLSNTD